MQHVHTVVTVQEVKISLILQPVGKSMSAERLSLVHFLSQVRIILGPPTLGSSTCYQSRNKIKLSLSPTPPSFASLSLAYPLPYYAHPCCQTTHHPLLSPSPPPGNQTHTKLFPNFTSQSTTSDEKLESNSDSLGTSRHNSLGTLRLVSDEKVFSGRRSSRKRE